MPKHDFEKARVAADYYVLAINSLYPTMRNGVDFAVAREDRDPEGAMVIEKIGVGEAIDENDVEAAAEALLEADPYTAFEPLPDEPPPEPEE